MTGQRNVGVREDIYFLRQTLENTIKTTALSLRVAWLGLNARLGLDVGFGLDVRFGLDVWFGLDVGLAELLKNANFTVDSRILIVAARRRSVSGVRALFERALASRALDAIEPNDAGSGEVASRLTIGSLGSETVSQFATHDVGILFIPQATAHRSPYAAMKDFDSSFVGCGSSDETNR